MVQGKPMSKTLEALLEATGLTMAKVRPGEVCSKCRDKRICDECPFHPSEKTSGTQIDGEADGPSLSRSLRESV